MRLPLEKGLALVRAHTAAERSGDIEATLATLEADPLYELHPVGRALRGMDAARMYYEHFFASFRTLARGSEIHSEWVNEHGVVQEYTIRVQAPGEPEECHRVVAIFTFGTTALAGERVYASERFLRLLLGPAFELSTPIHD